MKTKQNETKPKTITYNGRKMTEEQAAKLQGNDLRRAMECRHKRAVGVLSVHFDRAKAVIDQKFWKGHDIALSEYAPEHFELLAALIQASAIEHLVTVR